MSPVATRSAARQKRHSRIRLTLQGTAERPRLVVFRSLTHITAQVVDDRSGRTLASASSLEKPLRVGGSKTQRAGAVGKVLAERAAAAGVRQVVFDRAGFRYHGRVKSLADAAREGGLDF